MDFLFPVKCLECGTGGKYLCKPCVRKVRETRQVCPECERPAIDGMTHTKCQKTWGLNGYVSIWNYEGVIREAILKLKYRFVLAIAEELAEQTVSFLRAEITALPKDFLLIPIPLHSRRERWRGFNQAEAIGKLVAGKMGWDFSSEILVRKKHKKPQVELKGDEREGNVRGVFRFNKNCQPLMVNHQSFVLFDDVLTTGATLKEAGKVLKRNGAEIVWGLTIAK